MSVISQTIATASSLEITSLKLWLIVNQFYKRKKIKFYSKQLK